ncbi:PREDICTED: low-density lipoprotein receptor class A domain-containing protein 2 [Crocodylus porosus]|uniref:Low density lipoprotein receptor class A domain containing 2 n=1 Tax=Crocodylus porosus TaxID=8502 RepID=A0A7M4FDL2_CROPO|nr:PREDICTED: low-density lipoprotein receptor class A domain-containing protein 2 [Crocodylus porosus]
MAKSSPRHCLRLLSGWLVLFSFVVVEVSSIETVSLVDFCGQTLQDHGMIITSHRDSRRYYFVAVGTDCHLVMQAAAPRDKVQFQFRFFLVYSLLRLPLPGGPAPSTTATLPPLGSPRPPQTPPGGDREPPDPCHAGSYVQFYDGRGRAAEPLGRPLCGKSIPRPVLSTGNFLTLRLVTRGQQPRVDFVGDFTSFRLGFNMSGCGQEPYFPCRNGKCIPQSLVCDSAGVDNCGDGSDQAARPPASCKGAAPTAAPLQTAGALAASSASSCGRPEKSQSPPRDTNLQEDAAAGGRLALPALSALLGAAAGSGLLLWCCCSPGWLIWRLGACRFLPGCNSACAACQLCPRSCARRGKVAPRHLPA